MTIPLITGYDGFEIVRDKIKSILDTEISNQMSLATAALLNPDDYKVRIFLEQANAFDQFSADVLTDKSPIALVRYHDSTTDLQGSDMSLGQSCVSTYYIDIAAVGQATQELTGHSSADKAAAFNAHRAARLIRQILMHPDYLTLDLPGIVGRRFLQERTSFLPQQEKPINAIHGVRLALEVMHVETISTQEFDLIGQVYIEHRHEPEGPDIALQSYVYV